MKKYIDFGYEFDRSDPNSPNRAVIPIENMISEKHESLFSLIGKTKDAENIEDDLRKYASGKFPELKDKLVASLKNIHPYFKNSDERTNACLNNSLADIIPSSEDGSAQALFSALMFGDKSIMDTDIHFWTTLDPDISIFMVEEAIHNARMYVAFVLDDSNPELSTLPNPARTSMYSLIAYTDPEVPATFMNISSSVISAESSSMLAAGAMIDFDDDFASALYSSSETLADGMNYLPDVWKKVVNLYNEKSVTEAQEIYHIHTFQQLINLELFLMNKEGIRVNRCKSCGRLFPILTDGQEYCDFTDKKETSCYRKYLKKENKKKISSIYKHAYHVLYNKVKAGRISEDALRAWMEKAKSFKEIAEKNEMDPEDFKKTIKNM